jgi:cell division septum initiation protein DivIVA
MVKNCPRIFTFGGSSVPTMTETAAGNAETVADQATALADEAVDTSRRVFDAYEASYLTLLEGSFRMTDRWFEINRLLLEQAEAASRDARDMLDQLAAQSRKGQQAILDQLHDSGRVVQNAWLGSSRNGRR